MQGFRRITGEPYERKSAQEAGTKTRDDKRREYHNSGKHGKSKCDNELCNECVAVTSYSTYHSEYTIPCEVVRNKTKLMIYTLIDTGALQSNYVSMATGAWIKAQLEANELEARIAAVKTQLT